MAATQDNMTCAICTEVYTSPRFLPCYHTFCLPCLEKLANKHGDLIPCPTCRAPATVPPGGVCDLQVNFYFTEEALEEARSEKRQSMCPVHTKECVIFYCSQCDQAICIRCKLTKHEGHVTEDLSDAVARCKKTIEHELVRLDASIADEKYSTVNFKEIEEHLEEKQVALTKQIQVRHDAIVAMAGRYRDQAMRNLQKMSESVRKEFIAMTQPVTDEVNSLFKLQERARRAVSSACDMEVLEVEREMTRGEGSAKRLTELSARGPTVTYLPGLHGDFTNDIENCVKMYIGWPVKLKKRSFNVIGVFSNGRCGDGECCEVHALRQKEDKRIEVFYGGTGGDFFIERSAIFMDYNHQGAVAEHEHGKRVSPITRKDHIVEWEGQEKRILASKDAGMYCINQNCTTGECFISSVKLEQTDEKETLCYGSPLIHPEINWIHNFDAKKEGMLFAVVDQDEKETSNDESIIKDKMITCKERSRRVVRVYSNKSNKPVATYTPPVQPFFPTDVCFWGEKLLISDWMNDCVHVTQVDDNEITFIRYMPGDIVRPTALNVDVDGKLLIGCGDGLFLQCFLPASFYEK